MLRLRVGLFAISLSLQPPMLRMPSQHSCSETRSKCSTGAFCRLSAVAPEDGTFGGAQSRALQKTPPSMHLGSCPFFFTSSLKIKHTYYSNYSFPSTTTPSSRLQQLGHFHARHGNQYEKQIVASRATMTKINKLLQNYPNSKSKAK